MNKFWDLIKFLVLSVLVIICLFPFFYAFYISLQYPKDYGTFVGLDRLTLYNYLRILELVPLARWYLNTLVVTLIVVLSNIIFSTMAGYALARFSFPGRDFIFLLILGLMILPVQAYLIPLYFNVVHWGLQNTYFSIISPIAVYPFCIFLMRQYFLTIPKELEDAAKIDGLGPFGIFLKIGIPLSKSAVATQAILAFTWTWNQFVIPVTMINKPDRFVLTVGLNMLKDFYFDWPTIDMAGVIYTVLPIVIVFVILQRYIIQAFTTAGLAHF